MMRRTPCWPAALLGTLTLLLAVSPAWGCKTDTNSQFDWAHCWSFQRMICTGAASAAAFLFSFLVIFPSQVGHWRKNAPWPQEAFGRCLALAVLLSVFFFLVFFAWVENELRGEELRMFPASLWILNAHGRWLAVLAAALLLAWLIQFLYRHREPPSKAVTRS